MTLGRDYPTFIKNTPGPNILGMSSRCEATKMGRKVLSTEKEAALRISCYVPGFGAHIFIGHVYERWLGGLILTSYSVPPTLGGRGGSSWRKLSYFVLTLLGPFYVV